MKNDEMNHWWEIYSTLSDDARQELWRMMTERLHSRLAAPPAAPKMGAQRLRLYLGNFPPGLAFIHALITFVILGLAPTDPLPHPVWLAANYILSFYIAAWLWYILNRRWRPQEIRYI